MSLNVHKRKEQGRRDDMWSILYVLIEFLTGTLPWGHLRGIDNLDKVRDVKTLYNNEKLVKDLPEEFMKFMNHITSLKYDSRPDYELLHGILKSLFERKGGNYMTPFEWETPSQTDDNNITIYSLDEAEGKNERQNKMKIGSDDENLTKPTLKMQKDESEDKSRSTLTETSSKCYIL